MNSPAYHLRAIFHEYRSDEIVCRLVKFPGWDDNTVLACISPPLRPDKPVWFDTNVALLEDTPDFPNSTEGWPLMSRRMLDVLLSVGEFSHNAVPVTLIQDTIMPVERRFDEHGQPRPEYSKSDYVAVQLLSYADVFDRENSVFVGLPWNPDVIGNIRKLALSVPPEGLPPLFRISEFPVWLFVSPEARAALEAAGIRGPVYSALNQL